MKLADVSINRPVFAFMMTAALIVMGVFSYFQLGLDLMPKTDYPVVIIGTSLPGASSEEIETQITKPIEEVVNTINGVDELRASSDQGFSRCFITFVLERDIETAVQDVRDKVATIVSKFPRDTLPPVIQKIDPDAAPILTVAVSGDRSPKEITEIVDKKIKQVLETVKDVGDVTFIGDRRREIQLLLNADRMNAYGLTVDQVRAAVERQNVEVPGGLFISGPSEIALRTMGRIYNVSDFNRIILTYPEGSVVTFGDIGRAVDTVEEPRTLGRLDGRPAISLLIRKQSGTNTVAVVDGVLARIEKLKPTLPPDIRIQTIRDQSRFIRKSFEEIQLHLFLGSLLASAVVFFFIRNIRSTLIAALAIPASIIGTFTFMKAFGFTLNNMTMLALSLATGIVIDDAIVVLENIFRYVEEKGVHPREAAGKATAEIGLAVMATTLSLVVIFLPVAFMTGQVGRYFYSFGIASAAAIMLSMFVSFTLTPALCATWLRPSDAGAHGKSSKSRGFYAAMDRVYDHMLHWSLRHRFVMLLIAAAVSVSAVALFPRVGKELVPDDDQSEFSVNVRLPKGTSFDRTDQYVREIEEDLRNLPEVQTVFTNVNVGSANFWVGLTSLENRKVSQQELMRRARVFLRKYPGARIGVSGGTDISGASTAGGRGGGGSTNRIQVLLQGPEITELQKYAVALMEKMRLVPGVVDVDTNYEATQPELRVTADRARAADLGVDIDSLASSLRVLVGGEEVSKYKEGDDQYSVKLRLDEQFRNNPASMGELLIPSSTQKVVKVSDIARLSLEPGPASIDRYNRQRQISVSGNLDKTTLAEVIATTREKVDELNLKAGYQAVFGGSARTLAEASNDFVIAMILAVIFIYMVLASQFNSFIHPLTIMTALPLSLPAGLLALMAFGMSINVYSAIGLMMLFGIVKKNSILQVDYTNTLRAQGMERHEALIAANHVRLRPILMTTISIIAGMLPIAFGRGAGSGSRASMAVTIIGGQMLCLLLTLLITPVVYSYFDDLREWSPFRTLAWLRRAGKTTETVPPPEPGESPS
ncbi:MAG TPA: efflux RND transporter permease subunit [Acidobacteriota bacterium]|nr:efflux RND transporter permease subunit [Acidobacteriota bacterium]